MGRAEHERAARRERGAVGLDPGTGAGRRQLDRHRGLLPGRDVVGRGGDDELHLVLPAVGPLRWPHRGVQRGVHHLPRRCECLAGERCVGVLHGALDHAGGREHDAARAVRGRLRQRDYGHPRRNDLRLRGVHGGRAQRHRDRRVLRAAERVDGDGSGPIKRQQLGHERRSHACPAVCRRGRWRRLRRLRVQCGRRLSFQLPGIVRRIDLPGQSGARHADDELRQWRFQLQEGAVVHTGRCLSERARAGQGRQQFAHRIRLLGRPLFSAADLAHRHIQRERGPERRERDRYAGREGGCDLRADRDHGRRLQRNAIGQRQRRYRQSAQSRRCQRQLRRSQRIQWGRHRQLHLFGGRLLHAEHRRCL